MIYNTFRFWNMRKQSKPQEKIGDLLKSISNPVRAQILLAIDTGEACVCHLESLLGLRQAYISQQLMILRKNKIITSRREGKYIYYRLVKPQVLEIIQTAGEIVGVPKNSLIIQDHSSCECPKCSINEKTISTDRQVLGET
ncbi:MAG: winged helix-turn-helix transcriptional regulator, partial [Anaerolineales bacterium]|nr:winged helix-turn-helix transcriptional regulator [Anaerolineales bacterium]